MKLLQVTASIAPRDGGPSTGIVGLNRSLNDLGADAVILSTDADGPIDRLPESVVSAVRATGARAEIFPRSRPQRLKNSWGQARRIWRASRNVDIVHVHGVYLAHTVWAYVGARRHRTPLSIQPHGALEPYQRQFGKLHKGIWDTVIGRRILRNAAVLVAASEAEARNLRDLVPGTKVLVMPLGVRPVEPQISQARAYDFERWMSVPRPQRVLFLGRLARKKRPDLMIEAWQQTTNASQLAVVGPPEDWTHAQLRELAVLGRRDDLTVADALDPAAVAWLMSRAGIFVLPSENENFGISVAEAMFHGCAVVTTEQTAAGEHVVSSGAGTVIRRATAENLSAALDKYLSDETLTASAGARGADYASSTLTWQAAAQGLIQEYHHLTGS